jgi:hypothetical protein
VDERRADEAALQIDDDESGDRIECREGHDRFLLRRCSAR